MNSAPNTPESRVAAIYSTLAKRWGRQHWWPARSRFEVIVGAYLTQNTSWSNVEAALRKLRQGGVLTLAAVRQTPLPKLEQLIRSSGCFRQKAARLKQFVRFVDENYSGSLHQMFRQPTTKLREELLSLNGVGPETADSILLYAGQHPVMVVDAYTRRVAVRHRILSEATTYEETRALFQSGLKDSALGNDSRTPAGSPAHRPSRMSQAPRTRLAQIYNEMHGLIVGVGKQYCLKSNPRCAECPLRHLLPEQ